MKRRKNRKKLFKNDLNPHWIAEFMFYDLDLLDWVFLNYDWTLYSQKRAGRREVVPVWDDGVLMFVMVYNIGSSKI